MVGQNFILMVNHNISRLLCETWISSHSALSAYLKGPVPFPVVDSDRPVNATLQTERDQ